MRKYLCPWVFFLLFVYSYLTRIFSLCPCVSRCLNSNIYLHGTKAQKCTAVSDALRSNCWILILMLFKRVTVCHFALVLVTDPEIACSHSLLLLFMLSTHLLRSMSFLCRLDWLKVSSCQGSTLDGYLSVADYNLLFFLFIFHKRRKLHMERSVLMLRQQISPLSFVIFSFHEQNSFANITEIMVTIL